MFALLAARMPPAEEMLSTAAAKPMQLRVILRPGTATCRGSVFLAHTVQPFVSKHNTKPHAFVPLLQPR